MMCVCVYTFVCEWGSMITRVTLCNQGNHMTVLKWADIEKQMEEDSRLVHTLSGAQIKSLDGTTERNRK